MVRRANRRTISFHKKNISGVCNELAAPKTAEYQGRITCASAAEIIRVRTIKIFAY
jgi:hypothetical protein